MFRIGFGFDTHQLQPDIPLFLGGILIPHTKGSVGHSDADVLIHAIIDALLGAAGLRDIGNQFPDNDPGLKGIDSKILLERTMQLVRENRFEIGNIDSTVVLQNPKISAAIPEMIQTLAKVMQISASQISVKAKTSEKLGFIGREEGISAYAIVLLQKN
ncbi:MAG: 2-C-methyl-D-erythritol 2,4-cyclodiphosphate synthase [Bacteroidetes bacterium]|nr:2-C-methyl-D-erythritol 2,4-cyclodiphosphate synthase [Bacteroidota bacterium]